MKTLGDIAPKNVMDRRTDRQTDRRALIKLLTTAKYISKSIEQVVNYDIFVSGILLFLRYLRENPITPLSCVCPSWRKGINIWIGRKSHKSPRLSVYCDLLWFVTVDCSHIFKCNGIIALVKATGKVFCVISMEVISYLSLTTLLLRTK